MCKIMCIVQFLYRNKKLKTTLDFKRSSCYPYFSILLKSSFDPDIIMMTQNAKAAQFYNTRQRCDLIDVDIKLQKKSLNEIDDLSAYVFFTSFHIVSF